MRVGAGAGAGAGTLASERVCELCESLRGDPVIPDPRGCSSLRERSDPVMGSILQMCHQVVLFLFIYFFARGGHQ